MHFELVSRMAEEEVFKWGSAAPFVAIVYDELRRRKMCTQCRRGEVKHLKTLEKYSMETDEHVLKNAKSKMSGMFTKAALLLGLIKCFECQPWRRRCSKASSSNGAAQQKGDRGYTGSRTCPGQYDEHSCAVVSRTEPEQTTTTTTTMGCLHRLNRNCEERCEDPSVLRQGLLRKEGRRKER